MNRETFVRRAGARWAIAPVISFSLAAVMTYSAGCATSSSSAPSAPASAPAATAAPVPEPAELSLSPTAPSPDPRVGLTAGTYDNAARRILTHAAETAWNIKVLSKTPTPEKFQGAWNTDLAFSGKYAIQGNFNGYQVWDITDPTQPTLGRGYLCPASQSDVSVYKNLLFVSAEAPSARLDCGTTGVAQAVSPERIRGIRIFDVTDMLNPKYITNVQTCRGSHTHTVVSDPKDDKHVYIYVSGSAQVRSAEELPGCLDGPQDEANTARFRIEVIKVPLAAPQTASIVSSPRIFTGIGPAPANAERNAAGGRGGGAGGGRAGGAGAGAGRGGGRGGGVPTGPNQCHDITVYPAVGLAGGACAGAGLLIDIRDVARPVRIDYVQDVNMSLWHSATFSNDGTKVLFSDEWGGGTGPRCRDTDKPEWGADALFSIVNGKMVFKSYYKLPAAQTAFENCVAHNGSMIPIPGREVMVQGWYQGGISVFDWTDVAHAKEIAYFDRGPIDPARLVTGGSWSVYWYNGLLVSSEIERGLDIFELTPSAHLSQHELDAARTVRLAQLNAQEQPQYVWPPSFALTKAYLDQLSRSKGLAVARITAARTALASAERLSGGQRRNALNQLATQLNGDVSSAADPLKVRALSATVTDLANGRR